MRQNAGSSRFFLCVLSVLVGTLSVRAADSSERATIVVVVGAPGEEEYGKQFSVWADRWLAAARKAGAKVVRIGAENDAKESDHDQLRKALAAEAREGTAPLWLVLIGHGTFDGRQTKFNVRGPDVTAEELAEWCQPIKRPLAVIDCASSSAPLLNALSGPQRVIITATKSGQELNFARFGDYFSAAVGDASADLDKDGQTSLLEAFLLASRRVEEFYAQAARLATEHALLDDNGDSLGTPASWFQGVRATRRAKDGAALDGALAHRWHLVPADQERQLSVPARQRRDELELAIANLREKKASLAEDEYFSQLEPLLVEIARLYEEPAEKPAEPMPD